MQNNIGETRQKMSNFVTKNVLFLLVLFFDKKAFEVHLSIFAIFRYLENKKSQAAALILNWTLFNIYFSKWNVSFFFILRVVFKHSGLKILLAVWKCWLHANLYVYLASRYFTVWKMTQLMMLKINKIKILLIILWHKKLTDLNHFIS